MGIWRQHFVSVFHERLSHKRTTVNGTAFMAPGVAVFYAVFVFWGLSQSGTDYRLGRVFYPVWRVYPDRVGVPGLESQRTQTYHTPDIPPVCERMP